MNPWQVARQMKFKLAAATWPTGGSAVFSQVAVVSAAFDSLFEYRTPWCAIKPSGSPVDAEEPDLVAEGFEVLIAVAIHGDAVGQNATIGANRTGGQSVSEGRGLLEVEEESKRVIRQMADADGVHMVLSSSSDAGGDVNEQKEPMAVRRTYNVTAHCTTQRYYHPPRCLVIAGGVLTWALPPTRFDTRRMVVRRASGATPPATATSGTDVPVAALATTVTDNPGAGTWSYAIFMAYDETGSGTDERFSEQEVGTTRTV